MFDTTPLLDDIQHFTTVKSLSNFVKVVNVC
jgi:hypothetical protein